MKDVRNIWVYDLEIFPNFFSCVAINIDSNEVISFVLMKNFRNDLINFYKWIISPNLILIGYNNLEFDYQLLHIVLQLVQPSELETFNIDILIDALYKRTQILVDSDLDRREKKLIPEWKMLITQLDLYKISHFDNKAKATSLKWLEFALRMKIVADLPIDPNITVKKSQVDEILKYNLNDVQATLAYFNVKNAKGKYIMREAIALRSNICNEYGLNIMNANDVKIGVEIFTDALAKDMNLSRGNLKRLNTTREEIDLSECILPNVKYNSPNFKALLEFLNKQKITETKGVFKDLSIKSLGNVFKYCAKSENQYKEGKVKSKKLVNHKGFLEKLNIVYKGFQFDFGTGGIHGCIAPGIYKSGNGYIIVDVDVASFYPNLSIKNGFRPEHLGTAFCRVYEQIYLRRKTFPKSNPNNAALKLALNGVFGKSNSVFSFLYDPKFTMSITINGQLLLCMLAEWLLDNINDCTMLQINTDGLTVKIKEEDYNTLLNICQEWEKVTKLELEYVNYESMIIRDVNNYIGVYGKGKYKHKGIFEIDKDFHKNHSRRVVPIALHNYFIHNIPISQTIRQHIQGINFSDEFDNYGIYDYCIAKKATSGWKYMARSISDTGQYINQKLHGKLQRYYVSNRGVVMSKVQNEEAKGEFVEAHPQKGKSWYVTPFNNFVEDDLYDINYQYYIRECNKILSVIERNNQINLF